MTQTNTGRLATPDEFCEFAGLTKGHAAQMRYAGTGPVRKKYDLLARMFKLERDDPQWYGRHQRLAEILAPVRIYQDIQDPEHRQYIHTQKVLAESLNLEYTKLEEAWQTFEVLRLAFLLQQSPMFEDQSVGYMRSDDALTSSLAQYPDMGNTDRDPREIMVERAGFFRDRGTALRRLAEALLLGSPHVLGRDTHADVEPWRCDVAERLRSELLAEGQDHPLIAAGIGTDALTLATALRAVSHAIGLKAQGYAHARRGVVPDAIWLDTGKAPHEADEDD
jgi:hypothetical protein